MGLKDLIRQPKPSDRSAEDVANAAQAFIDGAPISTSSEPKRKRKKAPTFVRTTFSLSKDINRQIDKISLMPRNFRATRSDVIRAGILALQSLEKGALLALLENASKAEPIEDITQHE
jgi:Arc/MetJ-type ribon-helix-helix transcriptional regulator